jgi:hypothetical protein
MLVSHIRTLLPILPLTPYLSSLSYHIIHITGVYILAMDPFATGFLPHFGYIWLENHHDTSPIRHHIGKHVERRAGWDCLRSPLSS